MNVPEADIRRYQHRAMATIFEVVIAGEDATFAAGASHAAFEEIDHLEQDLSRHLPNSDISRINNLRPGESVRVAAHTFECLRLSRQFHAETGGAFDVATGALKDFWTLGVKPPDLPTGDGIERSSRESLMSVLELDETEMSVRVQGRAPLLDLGAIGKGFAVDRAAALLAEWGVGSALVHGGTSSAYAFGSCPGSTGWPVTISNPVPPGDVIEKAYLKDQGLGGSGIRKGRHIIDPRTGVPVQQRRASWVLYGSATRSDALSTACMIMTPEEIDGLIARDRDLRVIIVDEAPFRVLRFSPGGPAGGVSA